MGQTISLRHFAYIHLSPIIGNVVIGVGSLEMSASNGFQTNITANVQVTSNAAAPMAAVRQEWNIKLLLESTPR